MKNDKISLQDENWPFHFKKFQKETASKFQLISLVSASKQGIV